MARSEARMQFGIWRGLDGLSPHAKLMYAVLLTEPTVNHAGVGAVRVALWARNAGLTLLEAEGALRELTDGRFVVMDTETEEVFVRTMIRNDGVWKQPYVLKGALQEALLTTSPAIRWALAGELRKLPPKQPDGVSKSGKKIVYPDPHAAANTLAPEGSPDPLETLSEGSPKGVETLPLKNPFETHSKGNGVGEGVGEGDISSSVGGSVGGAHKRGTRIPDDFVATPEMVAWARDRAPDVDGKFETERFTNYWAAKAGREAIKLDWVRTWKNWMLEEQRRTEQHRPTRLRAVNGGRATPPPGYDENGDPIRDPKTGVWMDR